MSVYCYTPLSETFAFSCKLTHLTLQAKGLWNVIQSNHRCTSNSRKYVWHNPHHIKPETRNNLI